MAKGPALGAGSQFGDLAPPGSAREIQTSTPPLSDLAIPGVRSQIEKRLIGFSVKKN